MNIVFLGCGQIARSHSKRLKSIAPRLPRFYASRSTQRAEAFSRDLGGAGSFGSYGSAIADPGIDVSFICTPPDSHLELALRSLESGKHVIVEKPPFLSVADFDRAAGAASSNGRRLLIAENYFYKPLAGVLRTLLAEEVVGRPLLIHINATKKQQTNDWRDDPSLAGGGALFEGGIHWINFLANLGFDIASLESHRLGSAGGLERSSLTVIGYTNGSAATLSYSWEVPSLFKGLRISRVFGTEGSITFETNGLFVIAAGRKKRVILPGLSDISGYRSMLKDFIAGLTSDREPRFSTKKARRDLVLLEQAYASMESHRPINPNE